MRYCDWHFGLARKFIDEVYDDSGAGNQACDEDLVICRIINNKVTRQGNLCQVMDIRAIKTDITSPYTYYIKSILVIWSCRHAVVIYVIYSVNKRQIIEYIIQSKFCIACPNLRLPFNILKKESIDTL